ncbi:MAG: outer membrane lipoprotein-sorting protein [Thermodesulfobacteriota bacterium]
MRLSSLSLLIFALAVSPAFTAAPPDVMTLVGQMKEVFEPTGSRIQKVTISMRTPTGDEVQWVAGQARKQVGGGKRTLLVMLEPQHLRGTVLLIGERRGQPDIMWTYSPVLRRVRALVPVESYQRFLDTDFTYADLGFVSRQGAYRLLGEEEYQGTRAYKVELVPEEQWYYSRIITWIAADSLLPLRRDFYDRAGRLWKSEFFEEVATIDGKPTPLRVRMHDVRQDTVTELRVSDVRTDVELPDELFDPDQLPEVIGSPLWQDYSPQVATGAQPPSEGGRP